VADMGEDESGWRESVCLCDAAYIGWPLGRSQRGPCPDNDSKSRILNRKADETSATTCKGEQFLRDKPWVLIVEISVP
jgi:hypothetical protein